MGEAGSLERDERRAVVETAVAVAAGRVPVVVGVSAETPRAMVTYATDAVAAGATGVLVLPPTGYGADEGEVIAHFRAVADSVDLPIMAYNNPGATRLDLGPAQLARLTAEVSSIVAVQECSGDARRISELIALTDGGVEVMIGGDDIALEGFLAGSTGWVSGVAVMAPAECVELARLCEAGELAPAREVYRRLLPLARLDMTPKLVQYFKGGIDARGGVGGPTRPPRGELDAAEQAVLRDALTALGETATLAA